MRQGIPYLIAGTLLAPALHAETEPRSFKTSVNEFTNQLKRNLDRERREPENLEQHPSTYASFDLYQRDRERRTENMLSDAIGDTAVDFFVGRLEQTRFGRRAQDLFDGPDEEDGADSPWSVGSSFSLSRRRLEAGAKVSYSWRNAELGTKVIPGRRYQVGLRINMP